MTENDAGRPSPDFDAVDLFAGPGGWDEGARMVGLRTVGLEWDHAACQTAVAAGHPRIRCDVAQYPTAPFVGIPGLIASPPCQDFSFAGKRAGLNGDRGRLVWQVLRWADALRPEWIACEQVPPVLPIWKHIAHIMRGWGYSTWAGVLCAADYGVAQTRERAVLMASRVTQVQPPEPTHSREGDDDLFGDRREKWLSMADAIGWGMHPRPCVTITAGSGRQGGADPLDGGSGARATIKRERSEGRWVPRAFVSAGVTGEGRPKDPATQPADTLTTKGTAYWVDPRLDKGRARLTVQEAAILQSFPADYPWLGDTKQQFQQVGNAVPPRLAAHVLSALAGAELRVAA